MFLASFTVHAITKQYNGNEDYNPLGSDAVQLVKQVARQWKRLVTQLHCRRDQIS